MSADMLGKLLTVCLVIGIADGLLCYQCADSSGDDGKNKCQTYVRTMNFYRRKFETNGSAKRYVKNCTGFGELSRDSVFCAVMYVKSGESVKSFIRDCSDGQNFFEADYNNKFSTVISDNQTTCHYSGQGFLACVTMCNTDFCNGPSSASGFRPLLLPLILCMVVVMGLFKRDHE